MSLSEQVDLLAARVAVEFVQQRGAVEGLDERLAALEDRDFLWFSQLFRLIAANEASTYPSNYPATY